MSLSSKRDTRRRASSGHSLVPVRSTADRGRATFPAQHGFDRALLADREHDDRYTVFAGKRKGGGVHHLEVALDRFLVGKSLVAGRLGVLFRVGAVDAVHIRRLEDGLRVDLGG